MSTAWRCDHAAEPGDDQNNDQRDGQRDANLQRTQQLAWIVFLGGEEKQPGRETRKNGQKQADDDQFHEAEYNVNTAVPRRSLTPYFIGFTVVAMLASLGVWQISRGMDKRASLDAYSSTEGHSWYSAGDEVRPFQQLRVRGVYDSGRQLLLDNMIVDGRPGHFVITPLRLEDSGTLMLVNRGWVPPGDSLAEQVRVGDDSRTILGRVGRLPRAGMRMGDPFEGSMGWPRHAVYPVLDEVASLLNEELAPVVLLMDDGQADGFVRRWQPEELSASRHFGYAFQWFAMAAMASGLLVWRLKKRRHG